MCMHVSGSDFGGSTGTEPLPPPAQASTILHLSPCLGLQPGSPSPSLLLQTMHSITEGGLGSMQRPPSFFQHFSTLTAGSNARWLIFLSHPTTLPFSGSQRLHVSIGDLSPFHTAQKTHNQIHEATLHTPRKGRK